MKTDGPFEKPVNPFAQKDFQVSFKPEGGTEMFAGQSQPKLFGKAPEWLNKSPEPKTDEEVKANQSAPNKIF